MKRTLTLLLSLMLVVAGLTACSTASGGTSPTTAATATPAAATEAASAAPADTSPVTLTVLTQLQVGAELTDKLPAIAELEKRTNTVLQFTNVPGADLTQKVQTTIASGNLPDIMEYFDFNTAAQYATAGTFIKLDDLIQQYGPNIQKLWTKYPDMKKAMKFDDGNIYVIPRVTEREFLLQNVINNQWLTECNLQIPQTLDDLYTVLTAFKAKYGADSIPFGCGPWAGASGSITRPIFFAYDTHSDFMLFSDGKYQYGPYERKDQFQGALKYLNKLFKDGLLDPQMFSTTDDQIVKQISSSKIGLFCSWTDGYGAWGKGGSYNVDYVPCPPISGPDGKKHDQRTDPLNVPFYITKSCKDPAAALKMLDYLFSDEGIALMNWGVEGVTYSAAGGQNTYTDLILKNEQGPIVGRYLQGLVPPHFVCYAQADPEYAINNPLSKKAVEYMQGAEFPMQPILTGTSDENSKFSKIMGDIGKYVTDSTAKFITGEMNPDTDFAAFITQLEKMGINDAIAIKQAQFQRWNNR